MIARDTPEHHAGDQACPAAVIVEVEPAKNFARSIQPGDRLTGCFLHLGRGRGFSPPNVNVTPAVTP